MSIAVARTRAIACRGRLVTRSRQPRLLPAAHGVAPLQEPALRRAHRPARAARGARGRAARCWRRAASVDVVYLDLGRSGGHETQAGLGGLRPGGARVRAPSSSALRRRGELGAGDLVCLHTVRSDRFLVFLAGGEQRRRAAAARPPARERLVSALRRRMDAGARRQPAARAAPGRRPRARPATTRWSAPSARSSRRSPTPCS